MVLVALEAMLLVDILVVLVVTVLHHPLMEHLQLVLVVEAVDLIVMRVLQLVGLLDLVEVEQVVHPLEPLVLMEPLTLVGVVAEEVDNHLAHSILLRVLVVLVSLSLLIPLHK